MMHDTDVLIVGGGSAGCVLAARLSEEPSRRVTLIEAGADTPPGQVPADIDDLFPRSLANPRYFWPHLSARFTDAGQPRPFNQARVLGGGSSVMGLWAVRGLRSDYDGWADGGAKDWAYDDVLPFFRELERDLDFGATEPVLHGNDGPVPIRRTARKQWPGFVAALANAAVERGLREHADLSAGAGEGVFPLPLSTDGQRRISAAVAYLTPAVRRRKNLHIVTDAEVTALAFDGRSVTGANVRVGTDATRFIRAGHVVLAAGAIHSPALLLRSGIGPRTSLGDCGIPVIADLPAVGRNLQNHIYIHLGATIAESARQHPDIRSFAMACLRASSGLEGAPKSDLFLAIMGRTGARSTGNRIGTIAACLYLPFSRGQVSLTGPAPGAAVNVDFRYLSDSRDRSRLLSAARLARDLLDDDGLSGLVLDRFVLPPSPPVRLLNAPGMVSQLASAGLAGVVGLPAALRRAVFSRFLGAGRMLPVAGGQEAFDELVLRSWTTMFHPAGTCALGSVVDSTTAVKGVHGVFVADASIMPTIPSANTNIPTIMVAEKAASVIASAMERRH